MSGLYSLIGKRHRLAASALVRAIGIFFHAAKAAPTAEDCRDLAAGGHHGISGGRLSPPPETWARRAYRKIS